MEGFNINPEVFLYDYIIPCILACICGGIIGYDREKIDRPAGLRTHALVCLGSTVFTLISYQGFISDFDPSRIAAGIVTGIGFIGAGVIFRQGIFVKGVTTAASIWVVAAAGIALGTKLYYLAFLTTILGFIILTFVKYFEDRLIKKFSYTVVITSNDNFKCLKELIDFLHTFNTKVFNEKVYSESTTAEGKNIVASQLSLESRDAGFSLKIMEIIKKFEGITKVEII
ncbi:MAG: MgtC/SapB family protein [Actinobacteria bacterium]|nr:MgtC/SapB family protein [Actinomycetota bacterium]